MCEIYNVCQTLSTGSHFYWRLEDGVYSIHRDIAGPTVYTFSTALYTASLEVILRQPNGTPLGARGGGVVPEDSLGAALELPENNRPLLSYLAAIAVAEGLFQYEYLGKGPGRGIRLYPVLDEPVCTEFRVSESITSNTKQSADLHSAARTTVDSLRELASRVEASQLPEKKEYILELSQLTASEPPTIVNDIQSWEGSAGSNRFIYRFSVENTSIANKLYECLSDAKSSSDNNRKYSRINNSNADSLCLYVGSSKSITQRIKQHLGYAHPAIYSLHLKSWPNLPKTSVSIEILKYPGDVGQDVLQAIEDSLWQSSMPLFGKQGAR